MTNPEHIEIVMQEDNKDKPRFNISILEKIVTFFIIGASMGFLVMAYNHVSPSTAIAPQFPPWNPNYSGWPAWTGYASCFLAGIVVSLVGAISLWLIRYTLPEKLKPYITWRKLKNK